MDTTRDETYTGRAERAKYGRYFKPGAAVRDHYGRRHVVLEHRGCQVTTVNGMIFHPSKLWEAT